MYISTIVHPPRKWVYFKLGQPSQVIASGVTGRDVTPEAMTYGNDFAPTVK